LSDILENDKEVRARKVFSTWKKGMTMWMIWMKGMLLVD